MKKVCLVLAALIFLATLAACTGTDDPEATEPTPDDPGVLWSYDAAAGALAEEENAVFTAALSGRAGKSHIAIACIGTRKTDAGTDYAFLLKIQTPGMKPGLSIALISDTGEGKPTQTGSVGLYLPDYTAASAPLPESSVDGWHVPAGSAWDASSVLPVPLPEAAGTKLTPLGLIGTKETADGSRYALVCADASGDSIAACIAVLWIKPDGTPTVSTVCPIVLDSLFIPQP